MFALGLLILRVGVKDTGALLCMHRLSYTERALPGWLCSVAAEWVVVSVSGLGNIFSLSRLPSTLFGARVKLVSFLL